LETHSKEGESHAVTYLGCFPMQHLQRLHKIISKSFEFYDSYMQEIKHKNSHSYRQCSLSKMHAVTHQFSDPDFINALKGVRRE
jgi:hypothetical protein